MLPDTRTRAWLALECVNLSGSGTQLMSNGVFWCDIRLCTDCPSSGRIQAPAWLLPNSERGSWDRVVHSHEYVSHDITCDSCLTGELLGHFRMGAKTVVLLIHKLHASLKLWTTTHSRAWKLNFT